MTIAAPPRGASPTRAIALAERHLELLGAAEAARTVDWRVGWHGAHDAPDRGSEATCQALAALMALHGGERPRRLGLDVASAAAGVLAAQGVLAALLVEARGGSAPPVRTTVLDGALALVRHRLAVATAGGARDGPPSAGGWPPFPTADGEWVELEAVAFESWAGLFRSLGAAEPDVDAGWGEFARRYVTGRCVLPPALHDATRRRTLAELERLAAANGVAACRLRSYAELLAGGHDPDAPPWAIEPGASAAARPLTAAAPAPGGPLEGIAVVELTTRLQGPLAGQLLRMLGADVVKVEPPGGDPGRMAPAGPFRGAYLALNDGKRFAELDYKTAAGRRDLQELAAGADVFLHNARPGRADRLGLSFDSLAGVNPGIVHAQLAGWDPDGPHADEVAGDFIVQADSACGHGLNEPGEPAFPSPITLLDVTAGLLACEAVLGGLLARARHGRGSAALTTLSSAAAVLQRDVVRDLAAGTPLDRADDGAPLWGPLERPVETAGGWLVVTAPHGEARSALADACGATRTARDEQLAALLARRPALEWERLLADAGVPAAQVRDDLAALPADARVGRCLEPVGAGAWVPAAPWRFAA